MLMAGGSGHGLFGLFVEAEREALHFGEVTAALFRRHGLADCGEMLEHLRLALGAEFGDFSQFLLRDRPDVGGAIQCRLHFDFLAAIWAHISAHWGRYPSCNCRMRAISASVR